MKQINFDIYTYLNKVYTYKSMFPKRSYGELEIKVLLEELNIKFQEEVPLILINNQTGETKNVRIDFYIPDYKIFIEYNGRQHYEPVEDFGGNWAFEKQKERDWWVRQALNNNESTLIEVPYYLSAYHHVKTLLQNMNIK